MKGDIQAKAKLKQYWCSTKQGVPARTELMFNQTLSSSKIDVQSKTEFQLKWSLSQMVFYQAKQVFNQTRSSSKIGVHDQINQTQSFSIKLSSRKMVFNQTGSSSKNGVPEK